MQLEIIHRSPAEPTQKPPILCIHGAYHAAWCWEENFLPHFAALGYETAAVSLRNDALTAGCVR